MGEDEAEGDGEGNEYVFVCAGVGDCKAYAYLKEKKQGLCVGSVGCGCERGGGVIGRDKNNIT